MEYIGLADIERGAAITPDTQFELASASKTFTATVIMLLVEQNRLSLTSPVCDVLPEFQNPAKGRSTTIKDLLWHTSGGTDYLECGTHTPAEQMTVAHIMARLPEWSRAATPSLEYRYSNSNCVILARVIESVTNLKFFEFIQASLVVRLDLRSTTICSTTISAAPETAKGYRNSGCGLPLFEAAGDLPIDTDGDGGVASSLSDLIRWHSLFWKGEIVNEQSLRVMQTPGQSDTGESFEYGIGLQIESRPSGAIWSGHGGSWMNATTLIDRYLRERTTRIVLSNEFMAPVERISQQTVGTILAANGGTREAAESSPPQAIASPLASIGTNPPLTSKTPGP